MDDEWLGGNLPPFCLQAKDYKQEKGDWLSSVWSGFNSPGQTSRIRNTGVPIDFLKEVRQPVFLPLQWASSPMLPSRRSACLSRARCE